ncbi:hypothetical protein [Streptomyces cadmiisoli]|uniref:Uncharacterized protein n=1 Tax=Streptomyces cadmiisoli TaxID=2184053 RepID=A0A2Z4J1B4_9ACTN|nr:hypothetical protein [Streptomyces cadmiisoli]AWW38774.1 hypothetical protein DN051_20640 [Streptomyces cadmiisoli]
MTELDSELLGWVRDFIRDHENVTAEDITREFFPDDPSMARACLDLFMAGRTTTKRLRSGDIDWDQYADGETHQLTAEVIQARHGITIPQFRKRLSMCCRRRGRAYMAHKSLGVLYFRIGT